MKIKVIDNDVDTALKECKRYFGEIKRKKIRGSYYLRPGLRIREKKKIAAVKRRFYNSSYYSGYKSNPNNKEGVVNAGNNIENNSNIGQKD